MSGNVWQWGEIGDASSAWREVSGQPANKAFQNPALSLNIPKTQPKLQI
jgi:hypothetical protein